MGCLYQLTSPSGKSYIGITAQPLKDRWRSHRAYANRIDGALQKAIRKYGAKSFSVKRLVIADDYEYLKHLEVGAIRAFRTKVPLGYNMTDGGDGVLGVVVTPEARKNRSRGQQASFADPERRRIHRESQGRDDLRAARAERMRQLWTDPAFRAELTQKLKARFADPAYVKKLKARPSKPRINDGFNKWQRYRLKDLEAYRASKRVYSKTEAQNQKRNEYARLYRARMKALKELNGQKDAA